MVTNTETELGQVDARPAHFPALGQTEGSLAILTMTNDCRRNKSYIIYDISRLAGYMILER